MPKVIKKRTARKKPVQESEVKGAAMQAFEAIKRRQKQLIIGVSAIAAIIILFIAFSLYSTSKYKKAYSLQMEGADYYYGTGVGASLSDEERQKQALELYKESVNVKTTPLALFYLGNTYFKLNDYDNAINEYNNFISKFGGQKQILPLVYQKLASVYFKSNQNDEALKTLGQLSEVDDGIFKDTALILEARYYDKAGQKEKAIEIYKGIMAAFPASPWTAEASSRIDAEEPKKVEVEGKEPEVKTEDTEDTAEEKQEQPASE
jgi:tetratricopeptide (TPR) repeat protein